MVTWRNEQGTECKGTAAVHQQKVDATLRETSRDPTAKVTGEDKELERRKKSALTQNKKAMDFGDTRIPQVTKQPQREGKAQKEPR